MRGIHPYWCVSLVTILNNKNSDYYFSPFFVSFLHHHTATAENLCCAVTFVPCALSLQSIAFFFFTLEIQVYTPSDIIFFAFRAHFHGQRFKLSFQFDMLHIKISAHLFRHGFYDYYYDIVTWMERIAMVMMIAAKFKKGLKNLNFSMN